MVSNMIFFYFVDFMSIFIGVILGNYIFHKVHGKSGDDVNAEEEE